MLELCPPPSVLHQPNLATAGVFLQSGATLPRRATDSVRENTQELYQNFDVNEDAYAQALAALPDSTSQDATNSKGESIIPPLSPEETKNSMMELNSGLHGKVGSIEKWCGAASRRTNAADAATPHPRCRAGFSSLS